MAVKVGDCWGGFRCSGKAIADEYDGFSFLLFTRALEYWHRIVGSPNLFQTEEEDCQRCLIYSIVGLLDR